MVSRSEIIANMESVEEGDLVRWNSRTSPQVVTTVPDSKPWFEVRSHQDSYYRFYPREQYLVNQQSKNRYDVEQFNIIGKIYDIDDW